MSETVSIQEMVLKDFQGGTILVYFVDDKIGKEGEVWLGYDPFDANGLPRAYVLALATAEAGLFIDDLNGTVTKTQTKDRAYLNTSPTDTTRI